jgi:cell division protease FtsH
MVRRLLGLLILTTFAVCPGAAHGAGLHNPLTDEAQTVSYSKLRSVFAAPSSIKSVRLDPKRGRAEIHFKDPERQRARGLVAPASVPRLADQLAKAGVDVRLGSIGGAPAGAKMLLQLLLFGAVLMLVVFLLKKKGLLSGGGRFSSGMRADAQLSEPPAVRFSDVAGCEESVEEVREFVQFLAHPQRFASLGARMPSGALLYGPPGTGKTLLAKAVAGEAGVPFFAVSGSDFVEMFVGRGAGRVRDLFAKARAAAPSVIFIDEIDAVGKRRDGSGGGHDGERDQTLNQILVELDGFATDRQVVVLAATNRKETLDEALLRPGRLSRQVQIGLPDERGRRQILAVHAAGKPLDVDADLDALATVTSGSSGADLADILNEAAIMAGRDGRKTITARDLSEGHLRAVAGPEKRHSSMSDEERELVAFHEAGHVLCAELCSEHEKAQRTTIRPRGQAGGLALYGRNDRAIQSSQYLHERLVCALGGRAAEWVKYAKVSSGAANDLQQVNALARHAVEQLGFSPRAGQLITSSDGRPVQISEATRAVIDAEVERMVAEAYAEAIRLLETHLPALESVARALLVEEDLNREEIVAAVAAGGVIPQGGARQARELAPRAVPVLHQPVPSVSADRRRRKRKPAARKTGATVPAAVAALRAVRRLIA